jgi:hypothetical protein
MALRVVGRVVLERDDQDHRQADCHREEREQAADTDQYLDVGRKPMTAVGSQPSALLSPACHLVFHPTPARSIRLRKPHRSDSVKVTWLRGHLERVEVARSRPQRIAAVALAAAVVMAVVRRRRPRALGRQARTGKA